MMRDYTEEELEGYSKDDLIQLIINMQYRFQVESWAHKSTRDKEFSDLNRFLKHHGMTRSDYGHFLYSELFNDNKG